VPIGHSIVRTSVVDDEEASYVVELVLPEFNESLYYDPSIGLGVLLGRNDRDDDGGSSESNVGLIVGVAVAIPVAVALVLVVIGACLLCYLRLSFCLQYYCYPTMSISVKTSDGALYELPRHIAHMSVTIKAWMDDNNEKESGNQPTSSPPLPPFVLDTINSATLDKVRILLLALSFALVKTRNPRVFCHLLLDNIFLYYKGSH
jgi:hypothetical protein